MAETGANRRIKFAYHLDGWKYGGDRARLCKKGTKITPPEYTQDMEGNIFCPGCYTNLSRVPKDKDHFSNGREAYFAHLSTYKDILCDLRSTKPEGKKYNTFEEAQKAIDDENLVIVSGFLKDKPELPENDQGEYDVTPVEDAAGPLSKVPIARHYGESFMLPSRIKTIRGLCRKFDENLYKYFHLPGQQNAVRLLDLLHEIGEVKEEDDNPKLYYGVIKNSFNAGPTPNNVRMTEMECNHLVKDFFFKAIDKEAQEQGIHDDTKGRILIMYGAVTRSGIGLSIENLGWGEYALLPSKYSKRLIET